MNSTEILDAVNARLLEKWPERTVYINVCPEDYERPSFWLARRPHAGHAAHDEAECTDPAYTAR